MYRYFIQVNDTNAESPFRVIIPRKLRKSFIVYYHDSALSGDSSGQKSYDKLRRIVVTWPGMKQDVLRYARSCSVCQRANTRGGLLLGSMQSVDITSPWQIVPCDVMGLFPMSPRRNKYLLVVIDHFKKWVELFLLRKLTTQKVWDCLLETFPRLGFPAQLIADNATYITSKVFTDSCDTLSIRHKRTSVYHPQVNTTRRVNRNLKCMLVAHTECHKNWDLKLAKIALRLEPQTTG